MKKLILFLSLLAFSVTSASINTQAAESEKQYTLQQFNEILSGLIALSDGYMTVDKDGKQVKLQYKLGASRIPIASNMTLLRGILKSADEARVDLIKKYLPDTQPDPGTPEWNIFVKTDGYRNFTKAYSDMMNSPAPGLKVELARIKVKDLNIGDDKDQNAISPVVIAQIEPILDF